MSETIKVKRVNEGVTEQWTNGDVGEYRAARRTTEVA